MRLVSSRDCALATKCVQAANSLEHAGQERARPVLGRRATRKHVGSDFLEFELGSEFGERGNFAAKF